MSRMGRSGWPSHWSGCWPDCWQAAVLSAVLLSPAACAKPVSEAGETRQATVETNLPELQDCWTDIAGDYPGVAGTLMFSVEIRRSGSVDWVELELDELEIPKLSACAVRRIKRWRFPEQRRRSTIRFGVGFVGRSAE